MDRDPALERNDELARKERLDTAKKGVEDEPIRKSREMDSLTYALGPWMKVSSRCIRTLAAR